MNYLEALKYGMLVLKSNNINTFNIDSELLLSEVLNTTREQILLNQKKKILKKKNLMFIKIF